MMRVVSSEVSLRGILQPGMTIDVQTGRRTIDPHRHHLYQFDQPGFWEEAGSPDPTDPYVLTSLDSSRHARDLSPCISAALPAGFRLEILYADTTLYSVYDWRDRHVYFELVPDDLCRWKKVYHGVLEGMEADEIRAAVKMLTDPANAEKYTKSWWEQLETTLPDWSEGCKSTTACGGSATG